MRKLVFAVLLLGALATLTGAQTPALPDVPITHVSISATFTGYNSNGKMSPANIDTLGLPLMRNQAATQGLDVAYQHVAVPGLNQRWELGVATYWRTLPKVKTLLIDTSNFNVEVGGGGGKLLAPDGNRIAFTVHGALSFPIAGHLTWQVINYQYLRAFGGSSGVLNNSSQSASTGPVLHF